VTQGLLGNTKAVMALAGVVLVLAVVASFALSAFVPRETATQGVEERDEDPSTAQEGPETPTWADDAADGLPDDGWGEAALTAGDSDGFESPSPQRGAERVFNDYDPVTSPTPPRTRIRGQWTPERDPPVRNPDGTYAIPIRPRLAN
jgi:hypothetical protein